MSGSNQKKARALAQLNQKGRDEKASTGSRGKQNKMGILHSKLKGSSEAKRVKAIQEEAANAKAEPNFKSW